MVAALEAYAPQLGAVIWASSYCHASFARLFAEIVSPQNFQIGYAIWHSMHTDGSQRTTLADAAKVALSSNKRMLDRVLWAKDTADRLATLRNDATHLSTAFTGRTSASQIVLDANTTAPKRARRLASQGDAQKLKYKLTGDLIALAGYVSILTVELRFPGHMPLPRKPRMQSIQPMGSRKTRGRSGRTRRHQPQASRS